MVFAIGAVIGRTVAGRDNASSQTVRSARGAIHLLDEFPGFDQIRRVEALGEA